MRKVKFRQPAGHLYRTRKVKPPITRGFQWDVNLAERSKIQATARSIALKSASVIQATSTLSPPPSHFSYPDPDPPLFRTRTRIQGAIAGGNTARWSLTENVAGKSRLPQETKMSIQVKCKPVDIMSTCYLTIANGVRENWFKFNTNSAFNQTFFFVVERFKDSGLWTVVGKI